MTEDPLRGTGRTMARMLHAIANALENPHTCVEFVDHVAIDYRTTSTFRSLLRSMIASLNLQIEVDGDKGNPTRGSDTRITLRSRLK